MNQDTKKSNTRNVSNEQGENIPKTAFEPQRRKERKEKQLDSAENLITQKVNDSVFSFASLAQKQVICARLSNHKEIPINER